MFSVASSTQSLFKAISFFTHNNPLDSCLKFRLLFPQYFVYVTVSGLNDLSLPSIFHITLPLFKSNLLLNQTPLHFANISAVSLLLSKIPFHLCKMKLASPTDSSSVISLEVLILGHCWISNKSLLKSPKPPENSCAAQ